MKRSSSRDNIADARRLKSLLEVAKKDPGGDAALILADAIEEHGYIAVARAVSKYTRDVRRLQDVTEGRRTWASYGKRWQYRSEDWYTNHERQALRRTWSFLVKMMESVIIVIGRTQELGWWLRTHGGQVRRRTFAWPVWIVRRLDEGTARVDARVSVIPIIGADRGRTMIAWEHEVRDWTPHYRPPAVLAPGAQAFLPPYVQGTRLSSQQYLRSTS